MSLTAQIELGDGVVEEAVSWSVGDDRLRGNLITATADGDRPAVLILHGFGGVRSGPHNLLTYLARGLAESGYSSLRFDFRGRGESDGDPTEVTLAGMAEDALTATDLLKKRTGLRRVTLVGICSGGNVGIGILDRLPEVDGLFLLSVYPFGDGDSFRRDVHRSAMHLKEYWRRIWMPASWRKLVRGEINYRIILGILLRPFRRKAGSKDNGADSPKKQQKGPLDNLLVHRPRLRMTYGDADPDYEASLAYYKKFAEDKEYGIEFWTIAGANHNFYSAAWKSRLLSELREFLEGKAE